MSPEEIAKLGERWRETGRIAGMRDAARHVREMWENGIPAQEMADRLLVIVALDDANYEERMSRI